MHINRAPSWEVGAGPSPGMCFALYLRDCAGLGVVGQPAVSPVKPPVHCVDPRQVVHDVGGVTALRVEWEAWWYELVSNHRNGSALPTPPDFHEFDSMPALQRHTHAHYGTAMAWTQERDAAWRRRSLKRMHDGGQRCFGDLVRERELELGRPARNFSLSVIELPLSEPRAWYVEPDRLIVSEDLYDDDVTFRSFVQPVVEMIA